MNAIGIDLGLRDSVVAVCEGHRPRILDGREGKSQTRSIVGLKKRKGKSAKDAAEEILVGEAALDNWPLAPKDTIISVKRLMGRTVSDPEVEKVRSSVLYSVVEPSDGTKDSVLVTMGSMEYSPIDISAIILKKVKEDAEFRLNSQVTHAVITVPAYFSLAQREASREAGAKAGFTILKIVDEPTAAAISFGIECGGSTPRLLLVLDLRAETLDVSLLSLAENTYEVLHIEGDMWFGSDSFDEPRIDHVVNLVREEFDIDPSRQMRFMLELKKAVHETRNSVAFRYNRTIDLVVPGALQDSSGNCADVALEITRDIYERLIAGLVDSTVGFTKKALVGSKTMPDQIDDVLMVGDSTGIPLLMEAIEKLFGANKVRQAVHPKHCVALGAALIADRIRSTIVCSAVVEDASGRVCGYVSEAVSALCAVCGATLRNRTANSFVIAKPATSPFHYGIVSPDETFCSLVREGEPYPSQKPGQAELVTSKSRQRVIWVPIYGGEDSDLASANERQGYACIILPPGLPSKSIVSFKLGLDADGIFKPSAELVDGAPLPCWIYSGEPNTDGEDRCEVGYWREEGEVAMATFLLGEFSWALSENQFYCVQQTATRQETARLLEQVVRISEAGSDCAWLYVGQRAIEQLIQPRSRLTAKYLSTSLIEVECELRAGRCCAEANLRSFIDELGQCLAIFGGSSNAK